MLKLDHLSDFELSLATQKLVREERALTTQILWHLREVERRRLYLDQGFPSLFEYCLSLGYSEGSAGRRIAAMRVLRDLPGVEESLNAGKVSLSSLSSVHYFLEREKESYSTPAQKLELVQSLENLSTRDVGQRLAELSSTPSLPRDQEKPVGQGYAQIQFTASPELLEKLDRLRGLLAHKNPDPSYAELFTELADIALRKLDPRLKPCRTPAAPKQQDARDCPEFCVTCLNQVISVDATETKEREPEDG